MSVRSITLGADELAKNVCEALGEHSDLDLDEPLVGIGKCIIMIGPHAPRMCWCQPMAVSTPAGYNVVHSDRAH